MILFPFIDLSVFSVFITWALVHQDDSKELSGSLNRNAFERPEVGILNSLVVVFNKFQAKIFFLRVKTLGLASRHVKTKASLAVDMRRSNTPVLKLPKVWLAI